MTDNAEHFRLLSCLARDSRLNPSADVKTLDRPTNELVAIEDAAVLLPVTTAQDAWRLLAMTVDEANQPNVAAIALFERAKWEAADDPR